MPIREQLRESVGQNKFTDKGFALSDGKYLFSKCHQIPIVPIAVYLVHQDGQVEKIGRIGVCQFAGREKEPPCMQAIAGTQKSLANMPRDFSHAQWTGAIKAGAVCRMEAGFGVYFARDMAGILVALGARDEVFRGRKDQAKDAYQPEVQEEPF